MCMTLARKGLLAHVEVVKPKNDVTEAWLVSDAMALGIIAQGVEIQHQTKIRSATRAMHAWVCFETSITVPLSITVPR